jgi:hypothetical protein
MKLNQFIFGILPCMGLVLSAQAQMESTFDWQFSAAGNHVAPTLSINPSGAISEIAYLDGPRTYYYGAEPSGLFGTPSGLWSLEGAGDLIIGMDRTSLAPVDLTLVITQFINDVLPGTVSFSLDGALFDGRTTIIQQTGTMSGYWVEDTYHWTDLSVVDALTLQINSTSIYGALLLDRVKLDVVGDLVPVPEPATIQFAAMGALAFAARFLARRKSA